MPPILDAVVAFAAESVLTDEERDRYKKALDQLVKMVFDDPGVVDADAWAAGRGGIFLAT